MSDNKALEKALALVQRLYARTCEGKVDWEKTGDESQFVVQLGHFMLTLTQVPDAEYPDQPDFELAIVDETHTTIEQITNTMLRPVSDRLTEEGLRPYPLMARTFEMARRKALGVDDVLETIIQGLADE